MIHELVNLAERIRKDEPNKNYIHDSLCKEKLDAYICISPDGDFQEILPVEREITIAEDLSQTENKGRTSNVLPRLIVDNEKYVLGLPESTRTKRCYASYLAKLESYKDIEGINSILKFYDNNNRNGLKVARNKFLNSITMKEFKPGTNLSFLIRKKNGEAIAVHKENVVLNAIKLNYERRELERKGSNQEKCSCCGSSKYRTRNLATHGTISGVLPRNSLGNYLVSYEGDVYSSYSLEGNDNSLICTHCAKAYVEALNWLLTPSSWIPNEKKNKKPRPIFKNRKDISDDTVVVFWLRDSKELSDIEQLDEPNEAAIRAMIDSIHSGKKTAAKNIDSDRFYAITLSGVAARIAVRDWIEISIENLQSNLVQWFEDIQIGEYNKETKQIEVLFPRFKNLVMALKKNKEKNSVQHGRVGAILWQCAVQGNSPPLWLLSSLLNRIKAEQGKVTSERIILLKLYLNRKIKQQKGIKFMATLDESNKSTAYICGSIFAVLESIQYHASGGNLNAGIRERFFSSASTTPSTAFGRLMKLSQHHLSKIRGENAGLAINLDKKLKELFCNIEDSQFPSVFSLEDQASFAIGYYHQRQKDFENKPNIKEK
jgi:CRISPR-associated protein Csd1